MISVIISNYNGAAYLGEAMQSVLDQRYDDYELIVVDDGSTDDSAELIHRFAREAGDRVRAIVHETNRGQAEGFNTGFRAAQGDVVCLLDSDDYWFPNKLAVVRQAFDDDPDMALFQHNLAMCRDGKVTQQRFREFLVTGDGVAYAKKTGCLPSFVPTAGLAIRREVAMKVLPIPAEFRLSADGYLTRTVMCHGLINATHRCLGAYRVHENNGTFQNQAYDVADYIHEQLLPALNAYYASVGCELHFATRNSRPSTPRAVAASVTPRSLRRRVKQWLKGCRMR